MSIQIKPQHIPDHSIETKKLSSSLSDSLAKKEIILGVIQSIVQELGKDIDVAKLYEDIEKRTELARKLQEGPNTGWTGYQG